jgi:hypothetical protein
MTTVPARGARVAACVGACVGVIGGVSAMTVPCVGTAVGRGGAGVPVGRIGAAVRSGVT